jgi:hypothetical protein
MLRRNLCWIDRATYIFSFMIIACVDKQLITHVLIKTSINSSVVLNVYTYFFLLPTTTTYEIITRLK